MTKLINFTAFLSRDVDSHQLSRWVSQNCFTLLMNFDNQSISNQYEYKRLQNDLINSSEWWENDNGNNCGW